MITEGLWSLIRQGVVLVNTWGSSRKSPWDVAGEKLPVVDLEAVLLEDAAYGRPLHRIASVRRTLGLSDTNPAFELKLKELGLWPQEAQPLPFDASDLIWMLPRAERAVAYGLWLGVDTSEIARVAGIKSTSVYSFAGIIRQRWMRTAAFLGLSTYPEVVSPNGSICVNDIARSLSYPSKNFAADIITKAGLSVNGFNRRNFFKVWATAPRRDDLLVVYVTEAKTLMTDETYNLFFAARYAKTQSA